MNISATWDVDPLGFVPIVEEDVKDLIVSLAEKVFNGVVSRTPIYTGNLRASWKASSYEDLSNVVGGSVSNPLPAPVFPQNLFIEKPEIIYIMNTTPYAGLVEFGGPNNQPRAMVQLTLNSL